MKAAGVDYRQLVPYYDMRTTMRPGLTGWAQANGLRGPTENAHAAKARIDHDIAYIQNFTVWLDVRIICQTLYREFLGGTGV
jgi:lipopolysaccharide/colanic/teichoic acid biosynthesis glycosyltransferase